MPCARRVCPYIEGPPSIKLDGSYAPEKLNQSDHPAGPGDFVNEMLWQGQNVGFWARSGHTTSLTTRSEPNISDRASILR